MGAAANVSTDHVIINGVISHAASGSRRLLQLQDDLSEHYDAVTGTTTPAPTVAEEFENLGASTVPAATPSAGRGLLSVKDEERGIRVFASAVGTGRLHAIDKQLAKRSPTLHIAHRWEPAHKVLATKL
jgi:hypothetical protein